MTFISLMRFFTVLSQKIDRLLAGQERILKEMADLQSKVDSETAEVGTIETDLATATSTISAEIAALKANNPNVDFSKLDAAMSTLDAAVKAQPTQVG